MSWKIYIFSCLLISFGYICRSGALQLKYSIFKGLWCMLQNCPPKRMYQFVLPPIVNECRRLPFRQPSSCHAFISVRSWQNMNSRVDFRRKKISAKLGLFYGPLWITNVKLPSCLGFGGSRRCFRPCVHADAGWQTFTVGKRLH